MNSPEEYLKLLEDRDAWKQEFENAVKHSDEYFRIHETFLVRLCEILKVPYEDTSEEDILEVVKHLMEYKE